MIKLFKKIKDFINNKYDEEDNKSYYKLLYTDYNNIINYLDSARFECSLYNNHLVFDLYAENPKYPSSLLYDYHIFICKVFAKSIKEISSDFFSGRKKSIASINKRLNELVESYNNTHVKKLSEFFIDNIIDHK